MYVCTIRVISRPTNYCINAVCTSVSTSFPARLELCDYRFMFWRNFDWTLLDCRAYSAEWFLRFRKKIFFRWKILELRDSYSVELGGGVQMSKCLKFAQGLKFKTDFHSKVRGCRRELKGLNPTPNPGQFPHWVVMLLSYFHTDVKNQSLFCCVV